MKLSQILYKQHLGRMTRYNWYWHSRKVVYDHKQENFLPPGAVIKDPDEVAALPKPNYQYERSPLLPEPAPEGEEHPDWNDISCFVHSNNELLAEGLKQAQQISKTIVFQDSLPDKINSLIANEENDPNLERTHQLAKRILESSNIFDAHMELLPKQKDPLRPAWNFPRDYGLTDLRKGSNLCKKFLQLCDCLVGPKIASSRTVIDDAEISLTFEKEFERYKFSSVINLMMLSENPLQLQKEVSPDEHEALELPDIHPMHFALGLFEENIYKWEDKYPILSNYHKENVHTIFSIYDCTQVRNLTELPVKETQKDGRMLLKSFVTAGVTAKRKYGSDVKILPEPLTLQSIETNGKTFHFSVFQLNILDIHQNTGIKNYWWSSPKYNLFKTAGYEDGRPIVTAYNPDVFKRILAFYKHT